ncbi:RagB/SusD family nutrient uptake outer membrane protein [Tenacibaculum sp. 190524A02b]|uniref:Susd and RagB outer membrane lipoprotein n=1 Tax=Tenacibaculum vairaonense TaxID=3137860 RepID=A0ABP1F6S3_9FLAO
MKKVMYMLITSLVVITSCTGDFESINTNPNGQTEKGLTQRFFHIGGRFTPMFLNVINVTPAWNYQLQQGLNGDVYSGYMTPPTPFAGNVNNMTYNLIQGWNSFVWFDAYNAGTVMPNIKNIKDAVAELDGGGMQFSYLADIVKVAAMHRVSDVFGPIRYTKFNDVATTGQYDNQETVYKAFFSELGGAIDGLKSFADANNDKFKPFDMSGFEGNLGKWRKFANSLRLRLAIRISKIDPVLAKIEGEKSLASDAGLLDVEDMVIHTDGFTHPIFTISNSWGDIRMSAEMESILKGYNDPRIGIYFQKSTDASLGGAYKGIRMGVEISAKSQYVGHSPIGEIISKEEIVWMTASETYFLKAEAALRGWSGAGDVKQNYEAGITASFVQHKISGLSTYLMDATNTPNDFVDALNPVNNIIYPSDVKIAFNDAGTNEEKLEQIITQKWIAMFPNGQEAWSEFRRTGYPRVYPVVVNNSGGEIDTNIQIRRLPFIQAELDSNASNVQIAVGYLNGPDTGGTRLWWDTGGSNF